ncbi:MAG: alpha-amylase, partial [Nocardioides sp.]|nr:alpha-amylase [Nocardioides sp.]
WTTGGTSYGFGSDGAHLPQPGWFGPVSVEAQEQDPGSTLSLYRDALAARRKLQGAERLTWVENTSSLLHFSRPGGWHCVTNYGAGPVDLPHGEILLASGPLEGGRLPRDTTAWVAC